MKIFFNIIVVHLVLNLYVFYKGWKILPAKKSMRVPYIILFAAEFIFYILGFIVTEDLPFSLLKTIISVTTSWAIFIIYMSIALLLYDISRITYLWLCKTFNKRIYKVNGRKIKLHFYWGTACFIILMMGWGSYNFWHPVAREKNISIPKETPNIKTLKIAMASDLHIGYLNDREVLKMYVDKILEQKPDIILLGGDLIDYSLKPLLEYNADEEFKRLKAPLGVYGCLGNHEHYADENDKINWLKEKSGITILQDSVVLIDNSFYLVGREDRKSKRKSLDELLSGVDKVLPVIVLNHQPNNLKEETDAKVDLAFYGHTHNGQIFPVNMVTGLLYELAAGYKKKDETHIFVSSGLGLGAPQYRIGTKSELIVVNVTFNSSQIP